MDLGNYDEVVECLRDKRVERGVVPKEFSRPAYVERVRGIFKDLL